MTCGSQSLSIKRGQSFSFLAEFFEGSQPQPITGWQISSEIRRQSGELVEALLIADRNNVAGTARIYSAGTDAWPIESLRWDVRCEEGGAVRYSQTVVIEVERNWTEP